MVKKISLSIGIPKNKKFYWISSIIIIAILLFAVGKYHYLNHIKYAGLENIIHRIHIEMRQDFSQETIEASEHFGIGLNIRNRYNLWSEESEIRKQFIKYGVHHPDDMSGIIMETYLRSQKGIPFRLHRLIDLYTGFYESEDIGKYLKKMEKELYTFKKYESRAETQKKENDL